MIRTFAAQRVFPVAVLVAAVAATIVPACGGDAPEAFAPDPQGPDPRGALSGELTVHVFDLADRSELLHTLRLPDGQQRELRFASPP
jgi:hypothetical protein